MSAPLFRAATGHRIAWRAAFAATLLAIACGLGGCAGGGAGGASFALAGSAPTVAFESIDGPPPQVFERMVSVLDSELKLRNLQVVSREGSRRPTACAAISPPRSAAAAPPLPGSGTSMTATSSVRCGFPAKNRPARPAATPGPRPTISLLRQDRSGRVERPVRHDQRNGAGGCAAVRAGPARPGRCQRRAAGTRIGCIWARRLRQR